MWGPQPLSGKRETEQVKVPLEKWMRGAPAARSVSVGTWTLRPLSRTKRMLEVSEVTLMDCGLGANAWWATHHGARSAADGRGAGGTSEPNAEVRVSEVAEAGEDTVASRAGD